MAFVLYKGYQQSYFFTLFVCKFLSRQRIAFQTEDELSLFKRRECQDGSFALTIYSAVCLTSVKFSWRHLWKTKRWKRTGLVLRLIMSGERFFKIKWEPAEEQGQLVGVRVHIKWSQIGLLVIESLWSTLRVHALSHPTGRCARRSFLYLLLSVSAWWYSSHGPISIWIYI